MNLFDELTNTALKNVPNCTSLKIVVEKELLHHDILRILSEHHLLNDLTFIGGTCLRTCYGGTRLSEDLDFTGGKAFSRRSLSQLGDKLISTLQEKYGLPVSVSEPTKDKGNVDTWKIKVITSPQFRHIPAQRINIDICQVPSYEKQPMLLLNPYGIDMGTSGLVIQAQSREEIYTDKLLAFAFRPNSIKHRDLWDIAWLHQQNIKPNLALVSPKLNDRDLTPNTFINRFTERVNLLTTDPAIATAFKKEMQRFLPAEQFDKTIAQGSLWTAIQALMAEHGRLLDS